MTGVVDPFITNLPTGDHPTEQLAFKGDGWIYWSQGSTTNSGVVGLDNGGGQNQSDIPCQDITLSQNVFTSGNGVFTSGYSPFGTQQPGRHDTGLLQLVHGSGPAGSLRRRDIAGTTEQSEQHPGLRLGHRNGYAIRFAPEDHPLTGNLLVGEDGADERGARPSNGAPEVISIDQLNPDGTPVYHGWPDRYGFLPSSQAVFNPVGGSNDDVCATAPFDQASLPWLTFRMRETYRSPTYWRSRRSRSQRRWRSRRRIRRSPGSTSCPTPLLSGRSSRVRRCTASRGISAFSAPNATPPAPEVGHEVKLINFNQVPGSPLALKFQNFARNSTGDQAFVTNINGFNRPTNIRFGPDGCAYVADYGAVRDLRL